MIGELTTQLGVQLITESVCSYLYIVRILRPNALLQKYERTLEIFFNIYEYKTKNTQKNYLFEHLVFMRISCSQQFNILLLLVPVLNHRYQQAR